MTMAKETQAATHDSRSERDALLAAAIAVVERAGGPAVTVAEIAAAAGVDAAAASEIFASVDDLLVESALRMCRDDLDLDALAVRDAAPTVSAYARHFAGRKVFYRAMRGGDVATVLDARMAEMLAPFITVQTSTLLAAHGALLETLVIQSTIECFVVTNRWILESPVDEGPEGLYVLLEDIVLRRVEDARLRENPA